jgi:hypothetical protein
LDREAISMPINKTLVWILAGGAAVALGGVAIWLWRRRANSAALAGDEQPEPEPPGPETPRPEGDEKPPREALLDLEVRPVASEPAIVKPEPPPVLVPKNRRKRYRVGPGELIELRPSKAPAEVLGWKPSRPDVAVRVVEQDGPRAVVALDGPIGEVSVALLAANGDGEPRPVCSWKFELVEKAA